MQKEEGIAAPGGILLVRLADFQIQPYFMPPVTKTQGERFEAGVSFSLGQLVHVGSLEVLAPV